MAGDPALTVRRIESAASETAKRERSTPRPAAVPRPGDRHRHVVGAVRGQK